MAIQIDPDLRNRKIEESKRPFDPILARAELLRRNKEFIRQLDHCGESRGLSYSDEWGDFCSRWRINLQWSGDLATIERFVYRSEIICRRPLRPQGPEGPELRQYIIHPAPKRPGRPRSLAEVMQSPDAASMVDRRGDCWQEFVGREEAFIYVRISPWTNQREWEGMWGGIKSEIGRVYAVEKEERTKPAFFRNLCWYDLRETPTRPSYQYIAQNWRRWGGLGPCSMTHIRKGVETIADLISLAGCI